MNEHEQATDFDLYINKRHITMLDNGLVTISKVVRGKPFEVTHKDIDTAKDILRQMIKSSIETPQAVKVQKTQDFLNLINGKS